MADKKKFGLLIPRKTDVLKLTKNSIFNEDSDEDERNRKRPKIPQKKIKLVPKVKTELIEDPSIYEYDNIYDEMKLKQTESIAPKEKKNSRYIDTLLKAAEKKKKDYERRMDKKIQAEREKEGDKYKDKEAFVTSSYKKKMEEQEEEEEKERRENMLNDMMDVTKQKDLSGFYRHFLKQTTGEEKVPVFGERQIKIEKLSDDDLHKPGKSSPDYKNIDQDSDGIEIDSDDENQNTKKSDLDQKKKLFTKSSFKSDSGNRKSSDSESQRKKSKGSIVKHKSKTSPFQKHIQTQFRKSSSDDSQKPNKSSEDYKDIDQDSDGIEIDDEDENQSMENSDSGQKKELSTKNDNVNILQGKSSRKESEKEKSFQSEKNIQRHYRKSSESSASSDNDEVPVKKIYSKKQKKISKKHSRHDSESSSSNESDKLNKETIDSDCPKPSNEENLKKNIYVKRTVGDIFADAQARYFQRLASRNIAV